MKRSLTLLVVACLALGAAGWQQGGKGDDSAAVKARADEFAAAWNKHDAAAMAALWATDGDLINPMGRVAKGRAAVQTLFTDEHGTMMKDSRFAVKVSGTRFIADGAVALSDWDVTITNIKGADGATVPSKEYHVAVVLQNTKGTWLIESGRPYVFETAIAAPGKPATEPKKDTAK